MKIQNFIYICLIYFSSHVVSQEENSKLELPQPPVEFKEGSEPSEEAQASEQASDQNDVQSEEQAEAPSSEPTDSEGTSTEEETASEQANQEETPSTEETASEQVNQEEAPSTDEETASEQVNQEEAPPGETSVGQGSSSEDRQLRLKIQEKISTYEYDALHRKNPFSKPEDVDIFEVGERIHPLEESDLESLKLKAIIWSKDGIVPRALFETGDGQTYTVSKNDRIGSQGSVIQRIDRNVVWFMRPTGVSESNQIRYEPGRLSLEDTISEESQEGGLWYEK